MDAPELMLVRPSTATPSHERYSEPVRALLALQGSTTYFLESRADAPIEVDVLDQTRAVDRDGRDVLHRVSRLYLHTPTRALVVAEADIYLDGLAPALRDALCARSTGIGKLLDPDNRGLIGKLDLGADVVVAPAALQTRCTWALRRHYRLRFADAVCADIRETFNDESLERLR